MYRFVLFIMTFSMIFSACATTNTQHQREIALSEQRLGESYYSSGNYTAALKKLLTAEKVLPNDEYIQNSLGLVYMAKKRYDLAQIHFEKAIRLNPEFYVAKNHLGASFIKQQKYEQAITCFKEMLGNLLYATPENPLTNLGWIYLEKKEYTTAKNYFLEALEIRPCFVIATHGLATTYLELIQTSQAIELLQKCIEKIPQAAILHADLAKAYESVHEYDKAQAEWRMVLTHSPENSALAREAEQKINN